ncbi:MAG: LPS export ABC transporter permease LptF [Ideonella sp. MAG2]|nr:MAG: LPS export ABC transporter permease LptF [Ideonella sp. MAG2]
MYRDSEMAIWFSSGVPLSRFVRPVLRAGWPVIALTLVLVSVIWPWANAQIAQLKSQYQQRSDLLRVSPGSFQSSADGNRVFFVERAGEQEGAKHVFLLDKQEQREAVTTARSGRLISQNGERQLILETGQRNEQNAATQTFTRMTFEHYAMTVNLDKSAALDTPPPKATPTLTLLSTPSAANEGELTWRLGLVLAAANLLLLGIATAATNPRRASNWNLVFALLGFVIYYNMVNLSQAWVASQRLSMGASLLLIHGSALLLAVLLIAWRDHGAVATWREAWLRRSAP